MGTSSHTQGFTLVEMILVIALIGTLGSLTAFQDIGAYKRILARTDADRINGAFVKARSDAMQGVCASGSCDAPPWHGVMVSGHQAILFEGPSFLGRSLGADESFPLEDADISSGSQETIFAPITGESASHGE